jgi:hypothetical protein
MSSANGPFHSERWDITNLINQRGQPTDRLYALVLLWLGRANDFGENLHYHPSMDAWNKAGQQRAYRVAAQDLIAALDVIYPGWRITGYPKLIPFSSEEESHE